MKKVASTLFVTLAALAVVGCSGAERARLEAEHARAVQEEALRLAEERKASSDLRICENNLRQILNLACQFSDDKQGKLPFDRMKKNPLAYESLQTLARWDYDRVAPELFVCPADEQVAAAKRDEEGRYRLDEQTCSYWYTAVRIRLTDRAEKPVICCKNHGATILYATVGGTVETTTGPLKDLVGNTPESR